MPVLGGCCGDCHNCVCSLSIGNKTHLVRQPAAGLVRYTPTLNTSSPYSTPHVYTCACLTLQELLRKHGLIQAYGLKLAAASSAPTFSCQGRWLAAATRMRNYLCCCAGSRVSQAAADGHTPAGPLKTLMSPVALLLLLAYAAATVFYLYTRASRLADLGPQWW